MINKFAGSSIFSDWRITTLPGLALVIFGLLVLVFPALLIAIISVALITAGALLIIAGLKLKTMVNTTTGQSDTNTVIVEHTEIIE